MCRRYQFFLRYQKLLEDALKNFDKERLASIKIQAMVQQHLTRKKYIRIRSHILCIQKNVRRFLAKLETRRRRAARQAHLENSFLGSAATEIQRVFRGFFSRKYTHNYYARQAYAKNLATRANEVRKMLSEEKERRAVEYETNEQLKKKEQLTRGHHHLLSTYCIDGVFKSSPQKVCEFDVETLIIKAR